MKFTKYLVGLAASAGLLFGCQELEMVQICDPSEVIPPVLADVENITITAENQTETAVFTWDAADFGAKAAVNYALEASYGEKEFYEIVSGLTGTKAEISYEILNQNLYNGLELPADTPVEIKLYISARVGESQKHYSEPKTITVQVTAAAKVYPKLFIVGSYNGWSHDRNQYVFDFDGNDAVYSGIIDFGADHASNEFKITAGAWGKDEHSMVDGQTPEGANTELVVGGGANINVYQAKRYYQFSFLREGPALKLNFALNSLGISGDFNGWSWTEMAFDFATQRFYADIEIPAEGGLKFRECAENWDQNWGTSTPDVASKKGVLDGGENIKVPAGNYRMYLNMNNPVELVWELNADDFGAAAPEEPTPDVPAAPALEGWGVVGEFTEWADGKDIMMTETAGLLVAKNVTIESGKQFKIRKDGKWDDNRGAEGDVEPFEVTIGTALKVVAGGKNLTVAVSGSYDIYFDEAKDELYILVAGSPVPGTDLVASEWGIVGDLNGWAAPDVTMYKTAVDGMFVAYNVNFKADGGFKIRANGEWNDAANYGLASAGAVEVGKSYDLICGGGSGNMSIKAGIYDIWFDLTNSKVYILEPGKKPESAEGGEVVVPDPSQQTWHIVGAFNDWNPGDAAYIMTAEGDWYVFKNFTAASDTELKFAPGAWSGDKGGNNDAFALDTEFATGSANIAVPAGTYHVWLKKDLSVYKFTAAAGGSTFEPQASQWGIVGQVNGWAAPDITMYTTPTADLFVAKNVTMPAGPFKVRANNEWNDAANYGLASAGDVVVDHVYDVITGGGSGNMNLAAGTYDIYFDLANTKVYIMTPGKNISEAQGAGSAPAPAEKDWHIVGAFNNWNPGDAAYKMTVEGDWYVFKNFTTATDTELKFAPGAWSGDKGGDSFALDTEIPTASANIKVPAGTYNVWLKKDLSVYKFTVPAETIKIIYKNPAGWAKVNIYGWGDLGFGDWPGKAMTKVGDDWVYEIEKSNAGKSVSLIFNNGSGAQTVDLGPFTLGSDMTFDSSNAQIK